MKGGVSSVVFGFGLLTETLFAMGQTISPPFVVAQGPSSAPPSGVLMTPPLAPVAVPPSGVLMPPPTVERHAITTVPVKTAADCQKRDAPQRASGVLNPPQDNCAGHNRRSNHNAHTFGC